MRDQADFETAFTTLVVTCAKMRMLSLVKIVKGLFVSIVAIVMVVCVGCSEKNADTLDVELHLSGLVGQEEIEAAGISLGYDAEKKLVVQEGSFACLCGKDRFENIRIASVISVLEDFAYYDDEWEWGVRKKEIKTSDTNGVSKIETKALLKFGNIMVESSRICEQELIKKATESRSKDVSKMKLADRYISELKLISSGKEVVNCTLTSGGDKDSSGVSVCDGLTTESLLKMLDENGLLVTVISEKVEFFGIDKGKSSSAIAAGGDKMKVAKTLFELGKGECHYTSIVCINIGKSDALKMKGKEK